MLTEHFCELVLYFLHEGLPGIAKHIEKALVYRQDLIALIIFTLEYRARYFIQQCFISRIHFLSIYRQSHCFLSRYAWP